jgi:hypothetical protein
MPKRNPAAKGRGKGKGGAARGARKQSAAEGPSGTALQLTRLNWSLLAAAVVVIVVGFVTLGSASPALSTVVAPMLLVGGYAVLIPLGLIL